MSLIKGVVIVGGAGVIIALTAVMQQPGGTRAAGFGAGIEQVSRSEALAYAAALRFDTTAARSDGRRLVWRSASGVPQTATVLIAPERSAHRLTSAELKGGRVIARVRSSAPVPHLGFPRGDAYLWADSVRGGWRWVVIPLDTAAKLRQLPLLYETHATIGCENSGAKVIESAGGWVWVGCACNACCCVRVGPECLPLRWFGGRPGMEDARTTDPLGPVMRDTAPTIP